MLGLVASLLLSPTKQSFYIWFPCHVPFKEKKKGVLGHEI
jgi:hypothetical protein